MGGHGVLQVPGFSSTVSSLKMASYFMFVANGSAQFLALVEQNFMEASVCEKGPLKHVDTMEFV